MFKLYATITGALLTTIGVTTVIGGYFVSWQTNRETLEWLHRSPSERLFDDLINDIDRRR